MRILVVDDDRAVRESLRRSLSFNGYTVELAVDGLDALEKILANRPDAVVLDVMMPRLDGLEVCRRLRSAGDDLPILVLTARDSVSERVAGLDAGADDYLPKPFALEELLARLRALLRRTAPDLDADSEMMAFEDLTLDPVTREVKRGERSISLTRTEFSLLEMLMANPRRVLTRGRILEEVWGYDFPTSGNALEVYVGYLRRKTEADGEPRLIHTVRGVGYGPAGDASVITAPFGKNAEPKKSSTTQASVEMRPPMPLTRSVSLRWRVTLLAASVVAIAVAVMAIAAYAVVSRALYADVDHQLRTRAAVLIDSNVVRFDPRYISGATLYTTDISVALIFSDLSTYQPPGSDVPIGEAEDAVARGESDSSLRTVDGQRVLAQRTHDGSTLVIGQRLAPTVAVLDRLAWVLFVVGGCGVILAAVAGTTVGRTGLRPIARLTAATERVARTDDLTQIPVTGSDELARLTESFNTMLRALAESRERQSRLVAGRRTRVADAVDFVAHQHGIADRVKSPRCAADSRRGHGRTSCRRRRADRGTVDSGRRPRRPGP